MLKITIEGTSAAGKSATAFAIKHALAKHGINIDINGCEDEVEGVMDRTWTERIKKLNGTLISLETKHSNVKNEVQNEM